LTRTAAAQACGYASDSRKKAKAGIRGAELMPSATALTRANDQAIRRALENAGVEFIDAYNGGPGAAADPIRGAVVFNPSVRPRAGWNSRMPRRADRECGCRPPP
jgi:hypothetical protein